MFLCRHASCRACDGAFLAFSGALRYAQGVPGQPKGAQKARKGHERDMKRNGKGIVWAGLGWMAAFVIWTMLIQTVDVRAVGPNGTKVGFAALNGWFHALTGVHWALYSVTDWLGLVPLAVCAGFGVVGLKQWIQRQKLSAVDADILLLGGYYLVVIAAYLLFEQFPVNYRPVRIEGRLEASYPSSTTLLVLCVMPTLGFQAGRRMRGRAAQKGIRVFAAGFAALMAVGRMISGVHWLTDIIGAALLSAGLFALYRGAVWRLDARREEGKANWNCTKNCRH